MVNHPNRSKWLPGKAGTQFLQFACARITREAFPLGGYIYTVTDTPAGRTLYSGNDYQAAYAAAANNNR